LAILKALPAETQPMDALRTAASALGATDPDLRSNEPEG
jgi:citrate synthase